MPNESFESPSGFVEIFKDKFSKIKSATAERAQGLASWYEDAGFTKITKEVPAVLFNTNKNYGAPTDIWIEDIENTGAASVYIHDQVRNKLSAFLGREETSHLVGYIIEDGRGEIHLVVDKIVGGDIKSDVEMGSESYVSILDLLRKYGISSLIEKASKREKRMSSYHSAYNTPTENVVDRGALDKRREEVYFINLAQKYNMTNNQYLRLRLLSQSLYDARKKVSLEELAKSIIENPEDTGISVRPDLS